MFTILKENLYEKLQIASHFTLTRISSVPILQNGLLIISPDKLEIITTNLNDFFYSHIKIKSTLNKRLVVDIKKIAEFLSLIPSGKVDVSIDGNTLVIQSHKTSGTFTIMTVDDFPKVPEITGNIYTFKHEDVQKVLPLVLFAAATDDSRPVLSAINFIGVKGLRSIVATDGFRLSLFTHTQDKSDFPSCLLSSRVLSEIARLYDGKEGIKVEFAEKQKMVRFTWGDISIYSRVVDGDFPPYERVIPQSYLSRVTIDRSELTRSIKLASVFARDSSNIVVFSLKKDGLYISPKVKESKDAVVYQSTELEGEEKTIAFNYKYILDFLNNVKSDKVIFEMSDKNAPSVFRCNDIPGFIHIIMPVRTDED